MHTGWGRPLFSASLYLLYCWQRPWKCRQSNVTHNCTYVSRVNQHPLTLMSSIALAVWYLLESLARNLLPLGLARPLPPEGRPEPGLGVTVTSWTLGGKTNLNLNFQNHSSWKRFQLHSTTYMQEFNPTYSHQREASLKLTHLFSRTFSDKAK